MECRLLPGQTEDSMRNGRTWHTEQQTSEVTNEVLVFQHPEGTDPTSKLHDFLDPELPGMRVPISQPAAYPEGQLVPVSALNHFQGDPQYNFIVCEQVPERLLTRAQLGAENWEMIFSPRRDAYAAASLDTPQGIHGS